MHRPDVRALMARIRLVERPGAVDGMKRRTDPLHLIGRDESGAERVRTTVGPAPGSPDAPPTPEQLRAKVDDCLAHYRRRTGQSVTYGDFQAILDGLLLPGEPAARAAAGD